MSYVDYKELVKERINTKEKLQSFIDTALEDYLITGDKGTFLSSLRLASELQGGMTKLSRKTGLQREHLYTALSSKGNPSFDKVVKIIKELGFDIKLQLNA